VIDPAVGPAVQTIDARVDRGGADDRAVQTIHNGRIDQIVCFAFDSSFSMHWSFQRRPNQKPSRMEKAKEYLNAFVARAAAYRVATCYGCVHFHAEVVCAKEVSSIESDFVAAVNALEPGLADTLLWQGVERAIQCILTFDPPDTGKFPNARRRIVVISDGSDTGRGVTPFALAQRLCQLQIVLDAVIICSNNEFVQNAELAYLSALTGGVIFRPETPDEGLGFFEQEAFLNLRLRGEPTIPNWCASAEEFKAAGRDFVQTFHTRPAIVNVAVSRGAENCDLDSPAFRIAPDLEGDGPLTWADRRLLRELKPFAGNLAPAGVEVWVSSASLRFWRVFIDGPPDTPFQDLCWSAVLEFTPEYPAAPPIIRFLSVPYHPNVSPEGKLLFSWIDRRYTAVLRVVDIINGVVALLKTPEEEALRRDVYQEWSTDTAVYNQKASAQARVVARATALEYPYFANVRKNDVEADDAALIGESRYWIQGSACLDV
jgi:ubiquitin-protein ligase